MVTSSSAKGPGGAPARGFGGSVRGEGPRPAARVEISPRPRRLRASRRARFGPDGARDALAREFGGPRLESKFPPSPRPPEREGEFRVRPRAPKAPGPGRPEAGRAGPAKPRPGGSGARGLRARVVEGERRERGPAGKVLAGRCISPARTCG